MPLPSTPAADPPAPSEAPHVLDAPEAGGRAIRGAVLRTAGFAAGSLLALVSAPLLIRYLGVVDFGRYTTVVSLIALVGGLTEAGLGPVGVREYAVLEGAARDRFMRNLLGLRLALTTGGVAAATAFAVIAGYDDELVLGTVVAGAGLLVQASAFTLTIPLGAELRLGRQVAAELVGQVAFVALVVALVVGAATLVPFLAAPIVSYGLMLVVTARLVAGMVARRPAFEVRSWGGVLRDTLPVGLAMAVHSLYLRVVILIMSIVAAPFATGLFATSFRVTEVLLVIPVMLVGTMFPVVARAAHTDEARLAYASERILRTSLVAGVLLAGATAFGAGVAIDIVAGDEAAGAVPVLRIQSAILLLAFVSATLGTVLLSLRHHRALVVSSAIAFAVTLVLGLALVGTSGAQGGAIATVLGEISLVVAQWVALRRAAPGMRLPLSGLPRVVAAGGIAAGAAALAPVPDAAATAIFVVVYVGLAFALRAVPSEIVTALRRRR